MVDSLEQIAIDEQLLAQEGGEIGQAPAEAGTQLQVFKQPYMSLGSEDVRFSISKPGFDSR